MDDSEKGFSSTPIKPSLIPKFPSPDSRGADENGANYEMNNPKKPITKHFMSPTISAASKAALPRKKILAERNRESNFSDTHNQIVPIFNSRSSPVNLGSGRYSRSSSRLSSSESDDDDQNSFVSDDSSLKPYDPLTNYLSPRPKFLRFKPNRRRGVFLHLENGFREEKDGSGLRSSASIDSQKAIVEEDSSTDDFSPYSHMGSEEESYRVKNTEEDNSDDESEELEDRSQIFKGVFKFLLVIVVLFLSTFYISEMNSPNPSTSLQAIRGLKDEYYKVQNRVFEAITVKIPEGGSEFFDPREEIQLGSLLLNQRAIDHGFERKAMVEYFGELEKTQKVSDVLNGTEIAESEDLDQLVGAEITKSYGVYDQESKDQEEVSDHLQEIEMVDDTVFDDHELGIKGENLTPPIAFRVSEKGVDADTNSIDEQIGNDFGIEAIDENSDEGDAKVVVHNEVERIEDITDISGDENEIPERIDSENPKSNTIDPRAVVGVSAFFMVAASLCLVFHSRHKRASVKSFSPLAGESILEPVIANEIKPVPFHVEEDQKIQNPKVEFLANPKSSVRSVEEETKGFNEIHTPRVELLMEFDIGEMNSSLKSCSMKNSKMIETIESNTCVSQEKDSLSLSKLVSEFSAMDSPSFGSFTAEKKIAKKEEGKDGELRKVVTTPVRRSSRIHNRSIMSP